MSEHAPQIFIRKQGRAGRITLNRPKALNAVTWEMIRAIDSALCDWAQDDTVDLIIIDAAGDRAFAAGGDIVDLYRTGKSGDYDFGRRFWAEEYNLNARIRAYPKPYVAFMQGFVMGGGVGISCHGSHRIVGHTTQIAMPECAIGLVPDVGGSWLLARAPQLMGAFLGLTGYRMGPADAIGVGFADTYVPQSAWPDVIETLCATGSPDAIAQAAQPPETGALDAASDITACFQENSLQEILRRLDAAQTDEARTSAKTLRRQSPLAMACGLRLIHGAADLSFEDALAAEYRFVHRVMEHGDFLEGIRAQVIDKDRAPRWTHAPDADLEPDVRAMLAPLGAHELRFDTPT